MNYSEQLVSWYLRLNGFFPLPNFVLHGLLTQRAAPAGTTRQRREQNADIDVLALRLPHVYEEVGGNDWDWDREHLGPFLDAGVSAGLIVEVKTSQTDRPRTNPERLRRGVQRLGQVPPSAAERVAAQLHRPGLLVGPPPIFSEGGVVIGTLLVCHPAAEVPMTGRYTQVLSVETCERFIQQRMALYAQKSTARMFFGDELIQYLAWKGGVQQEVRGGEEG